jgi:hypothetical protein
MLTQCFRLTILGLTALLVLSSVGHAREKFTFTASPGPRLAARPSGCEIQVFQETKPDQSYVDVGVLNFHDERHRTNDGGLKLEVAIAKMKAYACKTGADAIIDIKVTEVRRLEFAMFNVRGTLVRLAPQ